jgi:hypothetical protein
MVILTTIIASPLSDTNFLGLSGVWLWGVRFVFVIAAASLNRSVMRQIVRLPRQRTFIHAFLLNQTSCQSLRIVLYDTHLFDLRVKFVTEADKGV